MIVLRNDQVSFGYVVRIRAWIPQSMKDLKVQMQLFGLEFAKDSRDGQAYKVKNREMDATPVPILIWVVILGIPRLERERAELEEDLRKMDC